MIAALAALVVGCMLAPATASADMLKARTAIRGLSYYHTIHGTKGSATISGRLIYRKRLIIDGGFRYVDAPLSGRVRLLWSGSGYGPDRAVDSQKTTGSRFKFTVKHAGYYRVLYSGDKMRYFPSQNSAVVYADILSVKNLRCVDSTPAAGGNIFCRVGADFNAPGGIVTTATPASAMFLVMRAADSPFLSLLDPNGPSSSSAAPSDPFGGIDNVFMKMLRHTGPCLYGFSVPANQANDVFLVLAMFSSDRPFVESASAVATFTPSGAP
jgi:hypothetical protein